MKWSKRPCKEWNEYNDLLNKTAGAKGPARSMVQEHQAKTNVTEGVMRIKVASETSLHQSGAGLGAIFKDE